MDKISLIRFIIINNEAFIDEENSIKSRGYYISKDLDLKIILKKKSIITNLVNKNIFIEKLSKLIQGGKNEKNKL